MAASRINHLFRALLTVLVALGAVWIAWSAAGRSTFDRAMRQAEWSLARHDFLASTQAARQALALRPESSEALLLAGISAAGQFQHVAAIELLNRVPPTSRQSLQADFELGERWLHLGRVELAERCYRRVLARAPHHGPANRRLAFLLQAEGRTWESQPLLTALIKQGDFGASELIAVASPERYFKSDLKLEQVWKNEAPEDIVIRLAEVRRGLLEGRDAEIRPLLDKIVQFCPEVTEALARQGRILAEGSDRAEFLAWNSAITSAQEFHPEIWYVRGLFARRNDQLPEAVRCFLEALVRAPSHLGANYQIGQCLLKLGRPEQARQFSDRVPLLFRLDVELHLLAENQSPEVAERTIGLLKKLGRHWEAAGWAHLAGRFIEPAAWSAAICREESRKLGRHEGLTAPASQPALQLNRDDFPLPDWSGSTGREPTAPYAAATGLRLFENCRFVDEAPAAAIDFTYFDGSTRATRMRHVIETLGGGVGVIDFDRDGWPDLYFAQGNDWRRSAAKGAPLDRLFRNGPAGRFVDVTEHCGVRETGFTHGVTVGDYDNDGWPDLYLGNLGPNSFYRNMGDGTFAEVTESTGTAGNEWSSSCGIADLTGDGLPDLFVVNYLDRNHVVKHVCEHNGFEIGCTPDELPSTTSRIYVNRGDGRFEDVSQSTGVLSHPGNGLGLVIADFTGVGRLSLFVGNDTTPNFLYRNSGPDAHGAPQLDEQGVAAGVAFNGGGNAMASMGIAAGDANGDGALDLFVTTYLHDADTLFVQTGDGSFVDGTRAAGLHQPTLPVLGFGSQCLDANNDGWEDIVSTNGHVIPPAPNVADDERDYMPSQLLGNLGGGLFAEVPATTLGEFFGRKALGRGLCELDWNRDGRQDFCVTYIHAPAALVTNRTEPDGHWLSVRVVGTTGARDAIGATGTIRIGNRRLTRQLTAGNGYLATNEPRLWFGLDSAETVDELVIHWIGGTVQRYFDLAVDTELLIIEGRSEPILLPRS